MRWSFASLRNSETEDRREFILPKQMEDSGKIPFGAREPQGYHPSMKPNLSEILQLSVEERLELVSAIWESIAEVPEAVELTAEQRQLLDERIESLKENPDAGSTWEEVRARILSSK